MKKLLISLCVIISLVGCIGEGTPTEVSNSRSDFEVKRLFKTDDITVYRFRDADRYIYFTDKSSNIHYECSNGESTERVQTICNGD